MDTKINFSALIASLSILWASSAFAADCKDNEWTFSVVPFFWAVNIDGDIEVGVPEEGIENQLLHISENFSNILRHVHSGGMLDINISKKNFGVFLNSMYASIKGIEVTTSGGFEVNVNSKFALFSAGAFYLPCDYKFKNCRRIRFGPYIGARYTKNESSAFLIESPELNSSHSAHWTEPIVGATLLFDIHRCWVINVAADVGFLKDNQDSYNIIGLIGYKPTKQLHVYIGYRELYQFFMEGSGPTFFDWKMHIGGPLVGVAFVF